MGPDTVRVISMPRALVSRSTLRMGSRRAGIEERNAALVDVVAGAEEDQLALGDVDAAEQRTGLVAVPRSRRLASI